VLERKWLQNNGRSFRFKASFSPCLILEIIQPDMQIIQKELAELAQHAPRFFNGSSVIIDPQKISGWDKADYETLKQLLLSQGLVPIGVRGGNAPQEEAAQLAGLPCLNTGKSAPLEIVPAVPENTLRETTRLVTSPVRSGMQQHAREGDLIVTSSVSAGAELVAAGHIHVYGVLRGRALAGANGNKDACIFCRTLEAELVSIAGYYLTKEEMASIPTTPSSIIQIYLQNEELHIRTL